MSRRAIGWGLGLLAVLGLVLVGVWLLAHGATLASFPWMPSAYEAKEYCSCRWVSGRDDGFCARFVHQDVVPSQGRVVDEQARRVTAHALGLSSSAQWTGPRTGCVVE